MRVVAKKQSREVRREQIAEAALELLARQGIRRLSVGAVARRIGVVPSAVYRHFRGKEEILSAAVGRMGDRLLENVLKAGAPEGDAGGLPGDSRPGGGGGQLHGADPAGGDALVFQRRQIRRHPPRGEVVRSVRGFDTGGVMLFSYYGE